LTLMSLSSPPRCSISFATSSLRRTVRTFIVA
jgi:hypothetical protein